MITIENVTKIYGAMTAVDDVSMALEKGTITVIVGTSGSGKSTLLRMINRLITPTSGRILLGGVDCASMPVTDLRRRIGYAIQGHGLFPHYTVADNIATVPHLMGWDAGRIKARVNELLGIFHLDPKEFAHKYPHQLSGGQQQRVGVARALAAEPELLLMDEPFGALDPVIRAKAQDDLLDIQRRFGTTIILVTHDMDEAFHLGDTIAVMKAGKVVDMGTPAAILTHPTHPFTSQLTGTADRALKLMSLTQVADIVTPIERALPHTIAANLSVREAVSEFAWRGLDVAGVTNADNTVIGQVSLKDLMQKGRQP